MARARCPNISDFNHCLQSLLRLRGHVRHDLLCTCNGQSGLTYGDKTSPLHGVQETHMFAVETRQELAVMG